MPSVGRIVHYHPHVEHATPEPWAAMIVKTTPTVSLHVWGPRGVDAHYGSVPFSDEPKPGHWTWPPRV